MAILPTDPQARKKLPLATGVIDYFGMALLAVAELSRVGNDQHNPGQSLRWDRSKSQDEADALMRHFVERGTLDSDGIRHSTKVAWRALALLQKELEGEAKTQSLEPGMIIYPQGIDRGVDTVMDDHNHANYVPAKKMGTPLGNCAYTVFGQPCIYIHGHRGMHESSNGSLSSA